MTTGGGDVSVQSSGLSINLVTKSGSNVFKGTFNTTFENDSMQSNNVSQGAVQCVEHGLSVGQPAEEDHEQLDRVRRADPAQPPLVVGRGRQAGHQRRHPELLRRVPGAVLLRPGGGAEGRHACRAA